MKCALCFKTEISKKSDGTINIYSPNHIKGREIKAMICSNCTSFLIQDKRSEIPWDGELKRKEPAIDSGPPTLRRRRVA